MAHEYPGLTSARWIAGTLAILSLILWLNHDSLSAIRMPAPLPVHTVLETITIVIFTSVFIVCWNAFGGARKKSSVILAVAFLCTAILGFMHAISFQGMPGFPAAEDMHKSLLFWLLSRSFIATTLLGLALAPEDSEVSPRQAYFVLIAGLLATAGWMTTVFIFPHLLPLTYIEGQGQTSFKLACEIGLIAINLFTAYQMNKQGDAVSTTNEHGSRLQIEPAPLFLAAVLLAISEVYFAIYTNGYDIFVAIGHVFQLLAAIAIYRGMVAINIHTPYATLAETSENLARSAEELSIERERLSRMIDTAIDGIITIDQTQSIILVNPAAAATFGYDVEDLLGASLNLVLPERHRKVHGKHVEQFGETGETRRKMGGNFEDFYVTGVKANGEEFPIEASISSQIENGKRFYTVIFRDITERKVAKEKMALYHDELTQLSAALQSIREEERKHIARELHDDLGQLLAALRMDLSLLQRDSVVTEKTQQTMNSMDQLLLTSITTLRRIATDLRPRALDEGGLYFALQTLQKDFSIRHGIDCELQANEEQLALDDARSTAIFRIVQESLTNVVRHAVATEVQIIFERTASMLSFSITDNGKGIEADEMRKSSSFGLVGMRERVKAMHGEFLVDSQPGEGTRLKINLPMN
ncbi:MASE3 domain-containing protein [Undibacterium pigrum]|uniref:Oxygen sensor histidine kinase NreB n=1 Tax=Undibacterium pigrum TaxID=401470 RepID=A0A318JHA5_9BURK|nr:MASE3 domain-containing protein [Undibacterium pigrum]PXX46602.1 PAS domain S-box-containing protein [Undibacterium pigrum]